MTYRDRANSPDAICLCSFENLYQICTKLVRVPGVPRVARSRRTHKFFVIKNAVKANSVPGHNTLRRYFFTPACQFVTTVSAVLVLVLAIRKRLPSAVTSY